MKNAAPIGITPRKIIVVACIVNSWLNTSGLTSWASGVASCTRMYIASMPPVRNMMKAVTPYRMPIFLWSIVVSQSQIPVGWDGRFGSGIASVVMGFLLTSGRSL